MMKPIFTLTVFICCALALSGCGEKYAWKQKLTVEVETPSGVVSGSSVMQVRVEENDRIGKANGPQWHKNISGEAVVVKLGDEEFLFALLRASNDQSYIENIALSILSSSGITPMAQRYKVVEAAKGKVIDLSERQKPMLVTFDYINDSTSVKEVDPSNLAATFGQGYSLKSMTLEITDEPVAKGKIENVLGWLEEKKNKQLDGNRLRKANAVNETANSLNILHFIRH